MKFISLYSNSKLRIYDKDKIIKIVEGELPDLTKNAYKVAVDRDIKNIGIKLKEVYTYVMEGKNEKVK